MARFGALLALLVTRAAAFGPPMPVRRQSSAIRTSLAPCFARHASPSRPLFDHTIEPAAPSAPTLWEPQVPDAMRSFAVPFALVLLAALAAPDQAQAVGSGLATLLPEPWADRVASSGFLQAWSLIFVSEIGDKTFFIAGLLAMKTSRFISFAGSMGALSVMTIISVLIGQIFHAIPPGLTGGLPLDDYAAVAAFLFFGVKTLKEAADSEEGELSGIEEERAEAEEAVAQNDAAKEDGTLPKILSTFGLVFAAEFGDRSFLSTIALSAAANPVSVAAGAISAHAVATGIAVAGGALLSKLISEKVIGYIGGSLFIIFAITTAIGIF